MGLVLSTADYLRTLVEQGGPSSFQYAALDALLAELFDAKLRGDVSDREQRVLLDLLAPALTPETMQGMAYTKPHGYAGDFEILERIYDRYICSDPSLERWDEYWQQHPAANAVRNRLAYFHDLLDTWSSRTPGTLRVLNVASGPCRDVAEYLNERPDADVEFVCVERDREAIAFAEERCGDDARITFRHANILKVTPDELGTFDLVWSAGFFHYFDDATFSKVLRKLLACTLDAGETVVGNFSALNPSRAYMHLFEWLLVHRSPVTLRSLALDASAQHSAVVESEPLGVNLFLRMRRRH